MKSFEDLNKKIDLIAKNALEGEIKINRDGQDVRLSAYRLDPESNILIAFAILGPDNKLEQTIAFFIDEKDLGKKVRIPEEYGSIQAIYKDEHNIATSGVIQINRDPIGGYFYGIVEAEFAHPDSTIKQLKDGIFSIK